MRKRSNTSPANRAGADSRVWLCYATVTALGFDRAQGIFADIAYAPSGDEDTAYFGAPYAGGGFGAYFPIAIGDTVLVANSMGDPANGPLIVGRFWNASDVPNAELAGEGDDPTKNAVIRIEPGQTLKIRSSGGGEVDIEVEGSGDLVLKAGAQVTIQAGTQVKLQAGLQSYVRGEDYASALNTFLVALSAYALALGPPGPPAPVTTATTAPAGETLITATNTFISAATTYLSQKIKGE